MGQACGMSSGGLLQVLLLMPHVTFSRSVKPFLVGKRASSREELFELPPHAGFPRHSRSCLPNWRLRLAILLGDLTVSVVFAIFRI